MISLTPDHQLWGYELFQQESSITHFVTHRQGGFSTKKGYESFNLSPYCGDEIEAVDRNKELLFHLLPSKPKWFLQPYQTHQDQIGVIDSAFLSLPQLEQKKSLQGIDALITNVPACCITIATADCVPILLYDVENKAIAAIHSGWRGALLRIVEKVVHRMGTVYGTNPAHLRVAIGPSISQDAFEVGVEVYEAFRREQFNVDSFSYYKPPTESKGEKYHLDLWECIMQSLHKLGVSKQQIELANLCTYTDYKSFFSARRLGIQSGRITSGIYLHDTSLFNDK